MKRFIAVVMSVFVGLLLVPNVASAFESLEVGLGYRAVKLVDPGVVVGTINKAANPRNGVVPFIGLNFTPHWGVQFSYNSLEAVAECLYPVEEGGNRRDGVFDFKGPSVSVVWRPDIIAPIDLYGGFGVALYSGSFGADKWWGNGFSSPEDYERNGPESSSGKTRQMYVDDALGLSAFIGAEYAIRGPFYIDFRVGYEKIRTDVSFKGFQNGSEMYSRGPYENRKFDAFTGMLALKVKF